MASDDLWEETRAALSKEMQPARWRTHAPQRLWRIARILLVGSAALQIVTLLLPWEHLDIVSNHLALDLGVSTFITAVPLYEILYASWLPHTVLAALFWDEFWRGALLFIGLLLVLAFCSATRAALRWSFAVLYGLWLLYTTVLALSFATTAHAIDTGASALPAHPAWWEH